MWQLLKTGPTGLCPCTSIYRIILLVWHDCIRKMPSVLAVSDGLRQELNMIHHTLNKKAKYNKVKEHSTRFGVNSLFQH